MKSKAFLIITILLSLNSRVLGQISSDSIELAMFLTRKNYSPIKLQRYPTGHLITQLKVNGSPGKFILDTGAGATIIENQRQDKFHLIVKMDSIKATGAGGSDMAVQSSERNTIELDGGVQEKDLTLKLISLENINGALRRLHLEEIDGIIGADLLMKNSAIIDYKNLILYLKN